MLQRCWASVGAIASARNGIRLGRELIKGGFVAVFWRKMDRLTPVLFHNVDFSMGDGTPNSRTALKDKFGQIAGRVGALQDQLSQARIARDNVDCAILSFFVSCNPESKRAGIGSEAASAALWARCTPSFS